MKKYRHLLEGKWLMIMGWKQVNLVTLRWRDVHGTFDATDMKSQVFSKQMFPLLILVKSGCRSIVFKKWLEPREATIIVKKNIETEVPSTEGWKFKTKEDLLKSITDLIKISQWGHCIIYNSTESCNAGYFWHSGIINFQKTKGNWHLYSSWNDRGQVVGLFTIEGASIQYWLVFWQLFMVSLFCLPVKTEYQSPEPVRSMDLHWLTKFSPLIVWSGATTIILIMITTTIVSYLPSRRIAKMKQQKL